MSENKNKLEAIWDIGFKAIKELETESGILASSKKEIYGCVFGRDSLITALKLLRVYEKKRDEFFVVLARKILLNIISLQGKEINIESGEEPGKCIHEYRTENHEHLTKNNRPPWFLYPNMIMKNYDTVDATSLMLIALYEYYSLTKDDKFLKAVMPNVKAGLDWLDFYGDSNGDGFIDYRFHSQRKFGGLLSQSWMDSSETIYHENGQKAAYPLAPIEVQAYTYGALRRWADYFETIDKEKSKSLLRRAEKLRKAFNGSFILRQAKSVIFASAIDGQGKPLISLRSSVGHSLWMAWKDKNGKRVSVMQDEFIPLLISRLMQSDIFESDSGVRTLSSKSSLFKSNSYHNGSIWPHDTGIIAEGMEDFGFFQESQKIRKAMISAFDFFGTPIELFIYDKDGYKNYHTPYGNTACRIQAWSAASMLVAVTDYNDGALSEVHQTA